MYPRFCWPFRVFLATNTLTSLSLLTEWVDHHHTIVKNTHKLICFLTGHLHIESVTPTCDNHEAEFTFPLSRGTTSNTGTSEKSTLKHIQLLAYFPFFTLGMTHSCWSIMCETQSIIQLSMILTFTHLKLLLFKSKQRHC